MGHQFTEQEIREAQEHWAQYEHNPRMFRSDYPQEERSLEDVFEDMRQIVEAPYTGDEIDNMFAYAAVAAPDYLVMGAWGAGKFFVELQDEYLGNALLEANTYMSAKQVGYTFHGCLPTPYDDMGMNHRNVTCTEWEEDIVNTVDILLKDTFHRATDAKRIYGIRQLWSDFGASFFTAINPHYPIAFVGDVDGTANDLVASFKLIVARNVLAYIRTSIMEYVFIHKDARRILLDIVFDPLHFFTDCGSIAPAQKRYLFQTK